MTSLLLQAVRRELVTHRRRTALTILGVVVGVTAVVAMVAAAGIAQSYVRTQLELLAGTPGSRTLSIDSATGSGDAYLDREALEFLSARVARVPGALYSPRVDGGKIRVGQGGSGPTARAVGAGPELARIFGFTVRSGRFLVGGDERRSVVVVNRPLADALYGSGVDLRRPVAVDGSFQGPDGRRLVAIVGVVEDGGEGGGRMYLPWQQVSSGTPAVPAVADVRHPDPARADHLVRSLQADFVAWGAGPRLAVSAGSEEGLALASRALNAVRYGLAAVAAVALIVGGLGVANVMQLSVTERTREIAIRRSMGANESYVRRLFLTESVVMTLVGGLLGLWLGLLLVATAHSILGAGGIHVAVDAWMIVRVAWVALVVSGAVGAWAGYRPAVRASRMPVASALRLDG